MRDSQAPRALLSDLSPGIRWCAWQGAWSHACVRAWVTGAGACVQMQGRWMEWVVSRGCVLGVGIPFIS